VTVIVRRPHAYAFLIEKFRADRETVDGSVTGLRIDGRDLPLPGLYVLDAAGEVVRFAGLAPGGRDAVLALLRGEQAAR
jgi:hypothetical protein